MAIARHPQIQRPTYICAELNLMVSKDLGPVVDELELVLAFGERTVTASNVQALAKLTYTGGLRYIPTAVGVTYYELRKSRRESFVKIYAGDTRSSHRLGAETVRKNVHVVTEVPEAEIGYQRRAE